MKKLTIIIPHYNSIDSLNKLIQSIPSGENIQTIIVDDFSKWSLDQLEKQIAGEGRHIEFYLNERFKGAGGARNTGIKYAKGEWILFADDDDYFANGFYEIIKKYLSSTSDVIFFKPTSFNTIHKKQSDRHILYEQLINDYLEKPNKYYANRLKYKYVVPWGKMIKTQLLLDNNIYFDEVMKSNDLMFSTKVGYYLSTFEVSEEVIYCVTRSKISLTTEKSKEDYYLRLRIFINYHNFLKERLGNKEFIDLRIIGMPKLIEARNRNFSLPNILAIYLVLKKYGVNITDVRNFNPLFIISRIRKKLFK